MCKHLFLVLVVHDLLTRSLPNRCTDIVLMNPNDPFDYKSKIVKVGSYNSPTKFPFLVASVVDNYNYVEKVKLLAYEKDTWIKYSNLARSHAASPWFSKLSALSDMRKIMHTITQGDTTDLT